MCVYVSVSARERERRGMTSRGNVRIVEHRVSLSLSLFLSVCTIYII